MNLARCCRCLLAASLAWLTFGLAGCGTPPGPPVVQTTRNVISRTTIAVAPIEPHAALGAASGRTDSLILLGREPLAPIYPVYPRSYRRYHGLVDPLDLFYDPFWPALNYYAPYHRDYLHPTPLYPRYYRPTPPPVIVRPLDPPPIRPRDRDYNNQNPPTPREPPPPPMPRRDPPPSDFRNEFPRPPR